MKPKTPILQSFYNVLALLVFVLGFVLFMSTERDPLPYRIMLAAGAGVTGLLLLGIGQVIGFLGESAHYSRLTFEAVEEQTRIIKKSQQP